MKFDLSNRPSYTNSSEWIVLDRDQRVNLHPLFKGVEEFICQVQFNIRLKCFYVEYAYNENTGKYDKGILSNSISNIVDDVQDYYSSLVI
jgi:hypothetical protein